MVIKDAQRSLIQQRKQGLVPAVLDRPGEGPPPSAGVLPTLLTYIPTPSTTSGESGGIRHESDHGRDGRLRRGEKVKEKVRGMKIGTGDRSSVRDGLRVSFRHMTCTMLWQFSFGVGFHRPLRWVDSKGCPRTNLKQRQISSKNKKSGTLQAMTFTATRFTIWRGVAFGGTVQKVTHCMLSKAMRMEAGKDISP